jgi:hypothetical protein
MILESRAALNFSLTKQMWSYQNGATWKKVGGRNGPIRRFGKSFGEGEYLHELPFMPQPTSVRFYDGGDYAILLTEPDLNDEGVGVATAGDPGASSWCVALACSLSGSNDHRYNPGQDY